MRGKGFPRKRNIRSLLALAAGVLLAVGCGRGGGGPLPSDAPSLLVVTIDTLRADHVHRYGGPLPTPALDGPGDAGATLLDACTPTPTTAPAHVSLWTGLHPWRHGVLDNGVALGRGIPTVAEVARAAGFATAAFVSSYILHPRFGLDRGFETYHFAPDQPYSWKGSQREAFWTRGDATTDAALAWLRAHRDRPFLVWVHYFDPHTPYQPPPGFERPASEPVSIEGKTLPPAVPSFPDLADLIRQYRGEVAFSDAQVGRLVAGLRDLDLLTRTTIVVTADHGEGLGDHGVLQHGVNLFEELIRVPLLVRAPGVPAGRRLHGAVQLEDLAPTMLALLGLPALPDLDGVNLLPWLRGEAERSPREVVVGRRKPYRGQPDLFYLRSGERKWIGPLDGAGTEYALDVDPREAHGVAAPVPPRLAALAAAAAVAPSAPAPDDETRRALRALGYLKE